MICLSDSVEIVRQKRKSRADELIQNMDPRAQNFLDIIKAIDHARNAYGSIMLAYDDDMETCYVTTKIRHCISPAIEIIKALEAAADYLSEVGYGKFRQPKPPLGALRTRKTASP